MLVEKENDFRDQKGVEATTGSDRCVYILNVNELNQAEEGLFQWDSSIVEQCLRNKSFTFDHRALVDYIGLLFLNPDNRTEPGEKICVAVGPSNMALIHGNTKRASNIIKEITDLAEDCQMRKNDLFVALMEKTITGHTEQHERIEDEIALLENEILTNKQNIGPGSILALQKELLIFKRFYEQLLHILDDIQEAKCSPIDQENANVFGFYARRVERLQKNVLVLREYVIQVRESYEAETDISLNRMMRLFTVVTVIFLPLTLIAGWYGMNLKMPEYHWLWSYPAVIAVSVLLVVLTIIIFKKKKWF